MKIKYTNVFLLLFTLIFAFGIIPCDIVNSPSNCNESSLVLKNGMVEKALAVSNNLSGSEELQENNYPDKEFAKLAPTVNMTFEELVGDNGIYDEPTVYPSKDTFYVIVDLAHQVVMVYEKDQWGKFTIPVRYMMCSTGSSKTPTPSGIFESGTHKVRYGLFVNDGVYGQYWTNITRRIYFHSLLYTRRDANSYTVSSYKNLGSRASHGCIRLFVPDARWIYYHIAPGTTIEIRKGSKEDIATGDIKKKLTKAPLPKVRPKLKKGEIPNTDNWSLSNYLKKYMRITSIAGQG